MTKLMAAPFGAAINFYDHASAYIRSIWANSALVGVLPGTSVMSLRSMMFS